MYQVYGGGALLHDNFDENAKLTKATLDLELGKTGSFEFAIFPNHPGYDKIIPMQTIVTVSKNYRQIYSGRVFDIKYGFYGEKQVSCEGELAFLLDSMIPPHTYSGSFIGYFDYVLAVHTTLMDAEQQFLRGNVTVAEFSPFTVTETEYKSAYDLLMSHMVTADDYLQVRYADGNKYLDLLSYNADISDVSGQPIELGKNMLDIKRETKSEDMFSAIIPLGAKLKDSEKRLDITAVNGNLPYIINDAARVACGGLIYRTVIFDNITNAQTLKTTGTNYLESNYAGESSVEITAADLSGQDVSIDSFDLGRWVRVINKYHFPDGEQMFLIKKMSINLLSPVGNKITIGAVKKGLSETVAEISNAAKSRESDAAQPYVMESGITGIWTWKKFSDNTCEFFGKIPVLSADVTSALGGWYRGANLYEAAAYEYPFTMTEAPALNMMFQTRNGLAAFVWVNSIDAETAQRYLPQAFLIRPTTATGIFGNINIIGKGKIST